MARPIVVSLNGVPSSFEFEKLDRSKLYGSRKRQVLGPDGLPCQRAELVAEGDVLVRSGMTAQGYFDEKGYWYETKELKGIGVDDQPVEKVESTLGVEQALEGPISATEALDLAVDVVYALEPTEVAPELLQSLQGGDIYRFSFSYRGGWQASTALLVSNDEGLFALVGHKREPIWCSLNEAPPPAVEEESDELDFEMF